MQLVVVLVMAVVVLVMVKTFERCLVKSQTKYQSEEWPGAAKILDIV